MMYLFTQNLGLIKKSRFVGWLHCLCNATSFYFRCISVKIFKFCNDSDGRNKKISDQSKEYHLSKKKCLNNFNFIKKRMLKFWEFIILKDFLSIVRDYNAEQSWLNENPQTVKSKIKFRNYKLYLNIYLLHVCLRWFILVYFVYLFTFTM